MASRSANASVSVVSLFADAFVSAVGVVAVSRGITFVGTFINVMVSYYNNNGIMFHPVCLRTSSAFVDVSVAGSSDPSGVASADGLVGFIQ